MKMIQLIIPIQLSLCLRCHNLIFEIRKSTISQPALNQEFKIKASFGSIAEQK